MFRKVGFHAVLRICLKTKISQYQILKWILIKFDELTKFAFFSLLSFWLVKFKIRVIGKKIQKVHIRRNYSIFGGYCIFSKANAAISSLKKDLEKHGKALRTEIHVGVFFLRKVSGISYSQKISINTSVLNLLFCKMHQGRSVRSFGIFQMKLIFQKLQNCFYLLHYTLH